MIKVLIIDDEPLVAENINAALFDIRDRFSVIATVHSGKEGLSIIEEKQPDIVITDIKMPGISGIDLIRICADRFPAIRFILISGYADFSYAQTAIECGAIAYCLKPLQDKDIQNALIRASQTLPPKVDSSAAFWEMVDQPENAAIILSSYFAESRFYWHDPAPYLAYYMIGQGTVPLTRYPHLKLSAGKNRQLFICSAKNQAAIHQDLLGWDQGTGAIFSIGFGGSASTMGELSTAINLAKENAYSFFLTGCHGYFHRLPQKPVSEEALRVLEQAIIRKDIPSIKAAFEKLSQQLCHPNATMRLALLCYNTLLYRIAPEDSSDRDYVFDYGILTQLFPNVSAMCDNLYHQTLNAVVTVDSILIESEKIKNKTLQAIVAYINKNFWKDLSVQSIASLFFVNMSYLCQVFKKETGYTITEYINQLRIEQARSLIQSSAFSLGEICEKVGYTDYCHFSKVFRRIVGKSPLQYSKDMQMGRSE